MATNKLEQMMEEKVNRRGFLKGFPKAGLAVTLTLAIPTTLFAQDSKDFYDLVMSFEENPKNLEDYVLANFKFVEGLPKRLMSETKFMEKKKGNCNEFAYFNTQALNMMGFDAKIYSLRWTKNGNQFNHATTIFVDKVGKWHYFEGYADELDSGKISQPFDSREELLDYYGDIVGADENIGWGALTPSGYRNKYMNEPGLKFIE